MLMLPSQYLTQYKEGRVHPTAHTTKRIRIQTKGDEMSGVQRDSPGKPMSVELNWKWMGMRSKGSQPAGSTVQQRARYTNKVTKAVGM